VKATVAHCRGRDGFYREVTVLGSPEEIRIPIRGTGLPLRLAPQPHCPVRVFLWHRALGPGKAEYLERYATADPREIPDARD
jgi:hypothetical protein